MFEKIVPEHRNTNVTLVSNVVSAVIWTLVINGILYSYNTEPFRVSGSLTMC